MSGNILSTLNAVSPIDGRYRNKVHELAPFFSEYGLIYFRLVVEIEYFIALCRLKKIPQLPKRIPTKKLRNIYHTFNEEKAKKIKHTESITNHDVKAVEYYLKEELKALKLQKYVEFIHFGLTSQDINNTAVPLSIKRALEVVYLPNLENLLNIIQQYVEQWAGIPMLSRTHGQAASPTLLGKELMVFQERLSRQIESLKEIKHTAKFGGAIGNMNAHYAAYPNLDWHQFAQDFLDTLGLERQFPTTQIEHYDNMAAIFDCLKRINTILIDFCRDIWAYISMDYFKQKIKKGEVGSSTMPHKVNPIDFENAEGNLGIANAIFNHLSGKLPLSRLQRDLTDSTVSRNIGVPFAHSLIAIKSMIKGLNKLLLNESKLHKDLEDNWAVLAEAVQTILRRENYPKPYEALKALTRKNKKITQEHLHHFIDDLQISDKVKKELKSWTPHNYIGKT